MNIDFVNEWLLIYGKVRDGRIVEDQVIDFPNPSAINPFGCRYYKHPYPWTVKGRNTTPLLEEHGYLDWGRSDPFLTDPSEERYVTLYRPGLTEGKQLSMPKGGQNILQVSYAPFRKVYLIPSANFQDPVTGKVDTSTKWPEGKSIPIWWLTPDGRVTEELIPYHPMASSSHRAFLPVKRGVFIYTQDIGLGTNIGRSGGYLARAGTVNKLIAGLLHKPVVSPDGCHIALVHEPQFPMDPVHGAMKVIDLCNGGTHE